MGGGVEMVLAPPLIGGAPIPRDPDAGLRRCHAFSSLPPLSPSRKRGASEVSVYCWMGPRFRGDDTDSSPTYSLKSGETSSCFRSEARYSWIGMLLTRSQIAGCAGSALKC